MTDKSFIDRLLLIINDLTNGNKLRFAEMLGISPAYIDRWTNQGSLPSAEHLANIKEKLGVNLNWLLTGKGPSFDIIPHPSGVGFMTEEEFAEEIRETAPPYGVMYLPDAVTDEEKQYIKKLIKLFHTKQDKTVIAIKQNIDAFLDTPNKAKAFKKTANEK